jgi:hypothetical protein
MDTTIIVALIGAGATVAAALIAAWVRMREGGPRTPHPPIVPVPQPASSGPVSRSDFKRASRAFWSEPTRSERLRVATLDWPHDEWEKLSFSKRWSPGRSIIERLEQTPLTRTQVSAIAEAYRKELEAYTHLDGISRQLRAAVVAAMADLRRANDARSLAEPLESAFGKMP